jgi:hypothetical protein
MKIISIQKGLCLAHALIKDSMVLRLLLTGFKWTEKRKKGQRV